MRLKRKLRVSNTNSQIMTMNWGNNLQGRPLLVLINTVCCIAIYFFGYDQGTMSGVNQTPQYVKLMNYGSVIPPNEANAHYTVEVTNSSREGGIVAVYYLGTLCGAILCGWFSDKFGRVNSIRLGCLWAFIGAPLQAGAQNMNWMICARVITGIGTGMLNVAVPVYNAEVSDYSVRGASIALEFFLNIAGLASAYWIEYGLSWLNNGDTAVRWRFPLAFQLLPLIILAILVNFIPESPRWLFSKGKDESAIAVLRKLRMDDSRVEAETEDIKESIRDDRGIDTSFLNLCIFPQGELNINRRVQISIWWHILQDWCGISSITVYQSTIFSQAGFDSNKSSWLSGLNNIFYMFSTLIAVFLVDRVGRRKLAISGSIGMAVSMFLIGGFSYGA